MLLPKVVYIWIICYKYYNIQSVLTKNDLSTQYIRSVRQELKRFSTRRVGPRDAVYVEYTIYVMEGPVPPIPSRFPLPVYEHVIRSDVAMYAKETEVLYERKVEITAQPHVVYDLRNWQVTYSNSPVMGLFRWISN